MSAEFPLLAAFEKDAEGKRALRVHAVPSALNPGFASTMCGLIPDDPRTKGDKLLLWQECTLFRQVMPGLRCGHCMKVIHQMGMEEW